MDKETEQFCADLLSSVREMKAGHAARVTEVELPLAAAVRSESGLPQTRFAELLGVSVRMLQQWEQGRREPSGAARTLLTIAKQHPEWLKQAS